MVTIPLSDYDWGRVEYLFIDDGRPRFGRPPHPPRQLLDAILWVLLNRERWVRLADEFPPPQTCYMKWLQWKRAGIMSAVLKQLEIDPQMIVQPGSRGARCVASRNGRPED